MKTESFPAPARHTRGVLASGEVSPLSLTRPLASKPKREPARALQRLARVCVALFCFSVLPSAFSLRAQGQYAIDWHKIAGGGGTSTNGIYSVSGTIGQPDATLRPMTGGSYSLTGGFWSLIAVVQTAGLPNLSIAHSGNSVIVSWPDTASSTLQSNNNLSNTSGWSNYGGSITTANGTNSVTITPPTGNVFFRLVK